MADQERLAVNRAATQPPVQENESVIEKAEEKEPSVQEKLDAILPDDFFGEFEDLFNSEDVHIKEQIKQDMSPDSLAKKKIPKVMASRKKLFSKKLIWSYVLS